MPKITQEFTETERCFGEVGESCWQQIPAKGNHHKSCPGFCRSCRSQEECIRVSMASAATSGCLWAVWL